MQVGRHQVRLGFDAPAEVHIVREKARAEEERQEQGDHAADNDVAKP